LVGALRECMFSKQDLSHLLVNITIQEQ